MNKPMQRPQDQPIGFWTVQAGEAIRQRIRYRLTEAGISQPQWWILHQRSLHPAGISIPELLATIGPNESVEAIEQALEETVAKGWVDPRNGTVHPTHSGTKRFEQAGQIQRELGAERMQGISEEEIITTITVLQRLIKNVGGHAWHW